MTLPPSLSSWLLLAAVALLGLAGAYASWTLRKPAPTPSLPRRWAPETLMLSNPDALTWCASCEDYADSDAEGQPVCCRRASA